MERAPAPPPKVRGTAQDETVRQRRGGHLSDNIKYAYFHT